jgi:hypothetical protein
MANWVFCIDFGSAYTKVALRRHPGADAELLRPDFRMVGVPDFCFPSAIGVERQGTRNVAVCGASAMGRPPGGGLRLHTNWKKKVFSSAEPGQPPQKPPLDAFLESPELLELAGRYGVTPDQVVHLQNVVANARALASGSGAAAASPDAQDRSVASSLAYHFFRWLRDEVMRTAERLRLDGLDPAAIPARITVPAFGHGKELESHPGCQLLLNALSRTGWRLHPDRPIISEPYSNAIGVLTDGANVVEKSRVKLRRMFGNGPLMRPLADPEHYPSYRALVIDIGAFTTDFATVTLKTQGESVDDPDGAITVRQHSARLGITDLDARVFESLPEAKREWLTKAAEPVQLEAFRTQVYTDGKPFRTAEVGPIGGAADGEAIRAGMDAFLQQLSVETAKFCDDLEPVTLQELILTGGGANIPSVRDTVMTAARAGGREFVKTHAPGLRKGAVNGPVHPLKEEAARGGTAIGGASVYFEKDFY